MFSWIVFIVIVFLGVWLISAAVQANLRRRHPHATRDAEKRSSRRRSGVSQEVDDADWLPIYGAYLYAQQSATEDELGDVPQDGDGSEELDFDGSEGLDEFGIG